MAPIDEKQRVERRMLQLLEDSGLPLPDDIEYGARCVRFVWQDRKVAVVVDIDEFRLVDAEGGYEREDIPA